MNNQENTGGGSGGHSEFELTFVLILIGLLGIAFLALYVGYGDSIKKRLSLVESQVDGVVEVINPDDVVGRDPDALGLRIDVNIGKFFTHPDTEATLYVTSGECSGECLNAWIPYISNGKIESGGDLTAIKRSDTKEYQYAWKGQLLYTYVNDSGRSMLGDGTGGVWSIARPE